MFRYLCGTEYFPLGQASCWFTSIAFVHDDFCSKLRPYVYRLNLSHLYSCKTNLSLNDLDFLLSNNTMKELWLVDVNVRDADGKIVPVDYVLGKIPSVKAFAYRNNSEIYSNQTWEKLNSIKLVNKLYYFRVDIRQTSEELDPDIIGKFIETNMSWPGYVRLYFSPGAPEIEPMKVKFQQIADNWMPRGAAPNLIVRLITP